MTSPLLETLSNQIVRKPFKLTIGLLHLIILSIENNRLLNLFHILYIQFVVSNGQFFDFEVCFECVSNFISSGLCDVAVEYLQLDEVAVVVLDQFGNCLGATVSDGAVTQVKVLQLVVALQRSAQVIGLLTVDPAVCDVKRLDLSVYLEYLLEECKILRSQIILTQIQVLQSIVI